MENNTQMPMLFPFDPNEFWDHIRLIVKEELNNNSKNKKELLQTDVQGLSYKPLYKIAEVCSIFNISKPTIYEWIKDGKLKPRKIRSRVFFLWNDLQLLLQNG